MPNPIPRTVRGWLYTLSILIGGLTVVAGPLMVALGTPTDWQAVIVSAIGALTVGLGTLARANLPTQDAEADGDE